ARGVHCASRSEAPSGGAPCTRRAGTVRGRGHHRLHYANGSGPQMNLHTLNRRLDRLDSARPIADPRVIRMVREEGETQADAIARWCSQNPSEPPPDESTDFIILRSIVSPN